MSEFEVDPILSSDGASELTTDDAMVSGETDPMQALLGAISRMMAESESRQSAALHEMQERISRLAAETRGTKDRLPGEFQGAFQQIEEAMEQLAAKIHNTAPHASVDAYREPAASDDLALSAPVDDQDLATQHRELASLSSQREVEDLEHIEIQDVEPQPFEPVEPARQSYPVDILRMLDGNPAGNPDDPWDESAAEQLTQLYESGEAGIPSAAAPTLQAVQAPVVEAPPQPATVAVAVDSSEQRAWLEDNFNRIISHIEATAAAEPENEIDHIELLDQRLEQMEFRLQGAMDALPRSTDLAAIQDIESCIVEFTAQLERSQAELERLAQVEDLVQDLASRLSEERLTELSKHPEIPAPNIDSVQIAELVAQQVSEVTTDKLISALPEPQVANNEELSEVKGLVNNLIAEQRNGGKQTTERLDILQQATLQLLERLEKVENTQDDIAKDIVNLPTARPDAPSLGSAVGPTVEEKPEQVDQPTESLNTPYRPSPRTPEPKGDQAQAAPEANAEQETATERPNRNNFVAEARRAAARANQRAASELGAGNPNDATLNDGQTDYDKPVDTPKTPRSSRTRLAIAAIALAVIGLGAGNYLLNMTGGLTGKPEKVSTGSQPVKQKSGPEQSSKTGNAAKPQSLTPAKQGDVTVKRAVASSQDGVPVGVTLSQASNRVPQAVPTALVPDAQPSSKRITGNHSQLSKDMPPALIGPLSLRLAAASGHPSATFEIGARFAEGKGVPQNFKEAAQWYTKSATRGFALAQYRLATLYERGLGVDKDLSRARIWYDRAARQGNVKSMHNLAVLTAGSGTGKADYGQAARWFTEAAERGLADSQFNLAILYENGLGVSKDLKQAYQWFGLAARAGDKDADARRKGLIAEMKPAELTQADSAVLQWRRKAISRLANDSHYAGLQWKKQSQSKTGQN